MTIFHSSHSSLFSRCSAPFIPGQAALVILIIIGSWICYGSQMHSNINFTHTLPYLLSNFNKFLSKNNKLIKISVFCKNPGTDDDFLLANYEISGTIRVIKKEAGRPLFFKKQ